MNKLLFSINKNVLYSVITTLIRKTIRQNQYPHSPPPLFTNHQSDPDFPEQAILDLQQARSYQQAIQ